MTTPPRRRGRSASGLPRRLGAAAGTLGVLAFAGGWVGGAALRPGYSSVHQAISQLARYASPHRGVMTAAFVVFGVGVVLFGLAVAACWQRPLLGVDVAVSGLATLGVALFPLSAAGGGAEDTRHATCATVGYLSLALAPALGRRAVGLPRLSWVVAVAVAGCLALTTVGSVTGLWQRLGLSIGDAWLLVLAARLYARSQPEGRPPLH